MDKYNKSFISEFNKIIASSETFKCMVHNVLTFIQTPQFDCPHFLNSSIGILSHVSFDEIYKIFIDAESLRDACFVIFFYVSKMYEDHYNKVMSADSFPNFVRNMNFFSKEQYVILKEKFSST